MATSIVSQLQRIKSAVQVGSDPIKRPFTRPSILYSPKDAADIDIDSILGVALSGLEALVKADERFRNYKNDLFSNKTRELDRELMNNEENSRIDESISLYLQLLSGYLHLPASLQTLEYLIRRYQIHERECNVHDLILCALPYHDTHAFVKIVQLLNIRDNKWKFLDGVKVSGAPPPRSVIVQQCIRDVEVLEALCDYASPKKKFNFSRPVISFCTAVFVEVLGSMTTINSSVVGKIYGFLDYGLKASVNGGSDHQAGALIIVGLLAEKVKLNSNLVKHWIRSIAEIASRYAKLGDEQWLWLALLALINLVQLQSVNLLPKNALGFLMDIRDLSQILLGLTREFDIERFLAVLVGSLVDHSCAGDSYYCALASVMEIVPMSNLVDHVVFRILTSCMRLSCKGNPVSSESGNWAKKTLVVINKIYPSELRRVVHKFLEDTKIQLGKGGRMLDNLCKVLDGNLDSSLSISNSKAWFGLHHPEASVRCATLSGLNMSDFAADAQDVFPIQDAILSLLRDDDLAVVKSSLSLNQLSERISCSDLLEALHHTLKRCLRMLTSGSSDDIDLAVDVAASIMKITVSGYHNDIDYSKKLAAMMFPLLLIQPKTQRLSLTALESAKEVKWPFFQNLVALSNEEKKKMQKLLHGGISPINIEVVGSLGEALLLHVDEHRLELIESSCDFKLSELTKCRGDFKLLEQERRKLQKELQKRERVSAFNLEIVSSLAETFLMDPGMHMPWLMESCSDLASSKTLFLLVLLQSFLAVKNGRGQFSTVFEVCFPVLKMEWEIHDFAVDVSLKELQQCECRELLFQLFDTDVNTLNTKILVCLFWRLLEAFFSMVPADSLAGDKESWIKDLFIFFAASRLKHVFKEHCHYLVRGCKRSPVSFLSRFFTEEEVPVTVQVESLHCFAYLCSENNSWPVELLAEFPAILVPLFSAKQDLRSAAMSCIEGLHALWRRIDFTSKKNGSTLVWSHFLDELLDLMIQQKELILSDKNYLSSFLISLLGFPHSTLSVPQNVERRLDQSTKDNILAFIIGSVLRLPAYGKLVVLSSLKGLGSAILCIEDVKSLLSRRSQYYFEQNKSSQKLSETEVKILCTLLEICLMPSSSFEGLEDCLLKALQLDSISPEDPGIAHPCITVLQKLNNQVYNGLKSEIQDCLFHELVLLFRSTNGDIQNATRGALLRLNISWSTVARTVSKILQQENLVIGSFVKKKKKKSGEHQNLMYRGERALYFLSSLLDILLLKKDITDRDSLLGPLFKLLGKFLSNSWVYGALREHEVQVQASSAIFQTISSTVCYVQQTLLLILKDICASLANATTVKDDITSVIDIKMLVEFAHFVTDGVTRNYVFSLLTSVSKIVPERILEHVTDIFTVIGKSTVTQIDSHSQNIFEELVSTVLPSWLSKSNNVDELLQTFVDVLPDVAEHRRLSIVVYLLRTLGECNSLASLLYLLSHSLVLRKGSSCLEYAGTSDSFTCPVQREWEYVFALQILEQYPSSIWLHSLVKFLQKIETANPCQELYLELLLAMDFIIQKLQGPELAAKLESNEDSDDIQRKLEELMERIVLQFVDARRKKVGKLSRIRKELEAHINAILRTITSIMIPSEFFKGIGSLLRHTDSSVRKKAFGLLCDTVKNNDPVKPKHKWRSVVNTYSSHHWFHLDQSALESFGSMCLEIVRLVDNITDGSNTSLALAVSTLEVLAIRFPSNHSIFSICLASVAKCISSKDVLVSSSSLRTTGALINVLGLRALPELPCIMKNTIAKSRDVYLGFPLGGKTNDDASSKESVGMSVLVILEAVIDKVGGLLSPYLGDIIELLVLHPEYVSENNAKFKVKADVVRKFFTEKIPVRLALQPLLKIYSRAVEIGDSSLAISFEMVANMVGGMDRSSVGSYHGKIFDHCLHALDLRRQHPVSIKNIDVVERSIINAMIVLTMKLTETMFKPLFIRSIEWAESEVEDISDTGIKSIDRAITLHVLVNKLAEIHRSLFVPYFKYLLEGCVRHLTEAEDTKNSAFIRKKKKAKIQELGNIVKGNDVLSVKHWHLKALVLSSLHKCFLYDTGNLKFLDSSSFQVLLKPIVSQIVAEPPASLEEHPYIPSVQEVDDLLVVCIGQMAVSAGSDLLWKPLNHEVLMQTRSEKMRSRILGLRIMKQFLDSLKEEYLVLIPETIPFLGELLEDVELPVKSLAQDVIKEMELMSGESLQQYL